MDDNPLALPFLPRLSWLEEPLGVLKNLAIPLVVGGEIYVQIIVQNKSRVDFFRFPCIARLFANKTITLQSYLVARTIHDGYSVISTSCSSISTSTSPEPGVAIWKVYALNLSRRKIGEYAAQSFALNKSIDFITWEG